jgi:hypothetical protein
MTLLEKYQEAFKDLKTEITIKKDRIVLSVWSEALLSKRECKNNLLFNLDGSEHIECKTVVNF